MRCAGSFRRLQSRTRRGYSAPAFCRGHHAMQTSAALGRIKPSPTLAITSKVLELKRAGVDVIGLGAGEPDFDTPDFIKDAAIEAIRAGKTKYTNVDGTAELKQANDDKYKRDNEIGRTSSRERGCQYG